MKQLPLVTLLITLLIYAGCSEGDENRVKECRLSGVRFTMPFGDEEYQWVYDNEGRIVEEIHESTTTQSFSFQYDGPEVTIFNGDNRIMRVLTFDEQDRVIKEVIKEESMENDDLITNTIEYTDEEVIITTQYADIDLPYTTICTWDEQKKNIIRSEKYINNVFVAEKDFVYDDKLNPFNSLMFNSRMIVGSGFFPFERRLSKNNLVSGQSIDSEFFPTRKLTTALQSTYRDDGFPDYSLELWKEWYGPQPQVTRETDYFLEYFCQ